MCGAVINNEFYKNLGEKWYTAEGDAVALLRLENKTKLPWVLKKIRAHHGAGTRKVLDVGCGGGFLTLELARAGHECTGVDVSLDVLSAGQRRDVDRKITWVEGPAEALPFPDCSFDVVCIMDVLEHVTDSRAAIREATRVLNKKGLLIVHTFNRTWLSWLFAAKGLDWFIKDSPAHIHDWKMFIKPVELEGWLRERGFQVEEFAGIHPVVFSREFFRLVKTGRVPSTFRFAIGGGLDVGYLASAGRFGNFN
jgi:2-polyprenyl-6-hydroxyphenyl methylase/3-demethylubiquinone-9 3-methyltransferase